MHPVWGCPKLGNPSVSGKFKLLQGLMHYELPLQLTSLSTSPASKCSCEHHLVTLLMRAPPESHGNCQHVWSRALHSCRRFASSMSFACLSTYQTALAGPRHSTAAQTRLMPLLCCECNLQPMIHPWPSGWESLV